jgi:hypothetical protein
MLSFETRASAAVGVAISVTTIPASAYWGVAIGAGQASGAAGAPGHRPLRSRFWARRVRQVGRPRRAETASPLG